MKNLFVFVLLLIAFGAFGQSINETKIAELKKGAVYFIYDLRYDLSTGTYAYVDYDTTTSKSKILSNKGNSGKYDFVSASDICFDNAGNFYAIAYNSLGEISGEYRYKYFFLKNGKELRSFENIMFPISKRDNGVYFIGKEDGKDFRVKYDFASGNFDYGQKYDTIYLTYVNKGITYYEGEPQYEIGFTKSGEDYYLASDNGKHFAVIGGKEMKKVDEIIFRELFEDNDGRISYIAKEISGGKNSYYVIQGEKEYNRFNYASSPLFFDRDNIPVYTASDSDEEYPSVQFLAKGNDVYSKKYPRGVWIYDKTPEGGIAYTGSDTLEDGTLETELVIDGKIITKGPSVWNIVFRPDGTPIYTAEGPDNTSVVISNGVPVSKGYSSIMNLNTTKSGKIYFTAVTWGDYEKGEPNRTYYVFDGKEYGPFDNIIYSEIMPEMMVANDRDEPAYIGTKIKKGKDGEDITTNYVIGPGWKSPVFDYISDLTAFGNDFYYIGMKYDNDGINSTSQIFKNGNKIGKEYDSIANFKLDKEKRKITFTGSRGNTAYHCEIAL